MAEFGGINCAKGPATGTRHCTSMTLSLVGPRYIAQLVVLQFGLFWKRLDPIAGGAEHSAECGTSPSDTSTFSNDFTGSLTYAELNALTVFGTLFLGFGNMAHQVRQRKFGRPPGWETAV
jgi:hypothetical protein